MSSLRRLAIWLGLLASAVSLKTSQADEATGKKVLIFTKSSGFQHPIINRYGKELSEGEKIMSGIVTKLGMLPVCTKDGSLITADYLKQFATVVFYTSGDLCTVARPDKKGTEDKSPGISPEGKEALLAAIKSGTGFVGIHSASDTWHTVAENMKGKDARYVVMGDKLDPYLRMLGAEFIAHDKHQPGTFTIVDDKFPGVTYKGPQVRQEMGEWYSLKEFAPDMHVVMVMETGGLDGPHYQRGPYPLTWARNYGEGRVFYTALGHGREDWDSENFRALLSGGIQWTAKDVEADITPNLEKASPRHAELPKPPPPKKPAQK